MRVLAISSQVVWGPVGNSAAVPALQARGHEVLGLPTIILSNHPGHGKPQGFRTSAEDMARMLETLGALGALNGLDAVLTGYFVSSQQVEEVERLLLRTRVPFLLTDPVLGDHGRLYVPDEVAAAIAGRLVPMSHCITPNAFELGYLSGLPVTDEASAIAAARKTGVREVIATSVPAAGGGLATLLVTSEEVQRVITPKLEKVPHGTGDFLSGLYLSGRLTLAPREAFAAAMKTLARAIAMSAGSTVLDVAGALHSSDNAGGSASVPPVSGEYIGIDGCPGGWLAVRWNGSSFSSPRVEFLGSIADLNLSGVHACAIDIPIGFMDVSVPGGRRAEIEVREFLKGKASSVFSAPCRKALEAASFEEALAINGKNSEPRGIGLSLQSYNLIPKLREVDGFMSPERQHVLHESHPEVAFAIMNNNQPVLSRKRSKTGQEERWHLLISNGFPADKMQVPEQSSLRWAKDDLLDACACAWSARRIAEGTSLRFPSNPPRDARGLRMEINA